MAKTKGSRFKAHLLNLQVRKSEASWPDCFGSFGALHIHAASGLVPEGLSKNVSNLKTPLACFSVDKDQLRSPHKALGIGGYTKFEFALSSK